MPRAGRPFRIKLPSSRSLYAYRRNPIGGPMSPPLPSAPWHLAQRDSKAWRPTSTASTSCTASPEIIIRSEEHTSELQSRLHLVCRLLLEKKKNNYTYNT